MTNKFINESYDVAMANGAVGGKLIGAGGGGFLMFYAEDKARLRNAMRERGLTEVRFRFEPEGTKILIQRRRDRETSTSRIGPWPFSLAALPRDSGRQRTRSPKPC